MSFYVYDVLLAERKKFVKEKTGLNEKVDKKQHFCNLI